MLGIVSSTRREAHVEGLAQPSVRSVLFAIIVRMDERTAGSAHPHRCELIDN